MDLHEIAEIVAGQGPRLRFRQGEITEVESDGRLTVSIGGSAGTVSGVRAFGDVCAGVGAGVWLATDGADLLAIGSTLGPAYCSVQRPTDQEIPNTDDTTVNFTASATIEADTHGMFATGSPSQLTVATPGVYLLSGYVRWEIVDGGQRLLRLEVNDSMVAGTRLTATATIYYQQTAALCVLAAGDVLKMEVRHNAGAAVDLVSGDNAPRLSAAWLRAVP